MVSIKRLLKIFPLVCALLCAGGFCFAEEYAMEKLEFNIESIRKRPKLKKKTSIENAAKQQEQQPQPSPAQPTQAGIDSMTLSDISDDILADKIDDLLELVDRCRALEPDYTPGDLVNLSETIASVHLMRENIMLRKEAAENLKLMIEAAAADGIILKIESGFRDYQSQERAYFRSGGRAAAKDSNRPASVAVPGHSQHQLGTTVDFAKDQRQWRWLDKNAGKYGFSLSYPHEDVYKTGIIFEPWHYRYISVEGVHIQDTFFGGSQHDMLTFLYGRCRP